MTLSFPWKFPYRRLHFVIKPRTKLSSTLLSVKLISVLVWPRLFGLLKLMARRSAKPRSNILKVHGQELELSNLEKLMYPKAGSTKGDVIAYYTRIAPYLLPHLKDVPVTLIRYPDGDTGEHFYEKDAPSFTPNWVKTFPVPRVGGGPPIHYMLINDLPTLVWSPTQLTWRFTRLSTTGVFPSYPDLVRQFDEKIRETRIVAHQKL
jgi:hypothetical protein